jgi:hypothetical protein
MENFIVLTDNKSSRLLVRYFALEIDGFAIINVSKVMKEHLQKARILRTIVSGVNAVLLNDTPQIDIFFPDLTVEQLSSDCITQEKLKSNLCYWNLSKSKAIKIPYMTMPCEAMFTKVYEDGFAVEAHAYPNNFNCNLINTAVISYEKIGLEKI